MALRSCAALGGLTAVIGLHVPETDNGLAFFEMGSESIEEEQDEEEAPIPKIPAHMTPAERKRLEEAAEKRIAGEKNRVKELKIKELKAKDSLKLHKEKAGKAKTDMHMYEDKVKENEDLLKADVAESEGHFKLARKLDAEADVLKKAAATEAKKLVKESHQIIDTEAQNAAKLQAAEGLKQLRGLLIGKLRQEVDAASKSTAVPLAKKATAKEVQAQQASFEANLTAEVSIGAKRDAKRVANSVVKKALFSKAGLAEAVAELAKKEVEKHSKRYAASEVKGAAGEKAAKALGKHTGPAAEAAVKKRAAQAKKNVANLYKTQMGAFGRQEKLAKKKGIALIPPETKKEEEEKLLEVLKKQGVHAALADAKKDRDRAAAEHKEATALQHKIDIQLRKAKKDDAAVKTPAEKKLGAKTVADANAARMRADRMVRMTKANVEKQHAVTLKLDADVKAYEAAKTNKKATAGDEAKQNKKAVTAAKKVGKKALKAANSSKAKAAAKKHLGKCAKAAAAHTAKAATVKKAVADEAANKGKGKPPAKAKGKVKRESEIQFMLQRATTDIADVTKDQDVLFKLTTADAAQAKIDMAKLKSDLAKTPKEAPWEKARVEKLSKKAKQDEKKAKKYAKKAKVAKKKAKAAEHGRVKKAKADKAKADKATADTAKASKAKADKAKSATSAQLKNLKASIKKARS